jgi:membrane-associated phospholipid phosphatase
VPPSREPDPALERDDRPVQDESARPERFARLNAGESDLVERTLPTVRPPRPLLVVSRLADGSRLWLAIAAVLALRPRLRRTAVEGVVAVLLAAGGTQVLQRLVGRPRPPAHHPVRRALAHQPDTPSFPSSHTAVGVAFTTAVARRHRRLGAVLAPLALTLAYGRVRLRVHWPTDVLGGAVLGLGAGRAAGRFTFRCLGTIGFPGLAPRTPVRAACRRREDENEARTRDELPMTGCPRA